MNRCATCGKPVPPREKNPAAPFCSERCRIVDLGKWLNEQHSLPLEDGAAGAADASEAQGELEGTESS